MTAVPFSEAVMRAVLASLAGVLAIGGAYALRDLRWRQRHRRHPLIYSCGECGHVYEDDRHVPLSACPRCGRLNEAVRR